MGIRRIGKKARIFYFIDNVGAVRENLVFYAVELVAKHQSLELHAQTVGELASFCKEFLTDVGNLAFVELAVNNEIVIVCHDSLADGVVSNEFFDEIFDSGIAVVETTALFSREHYILDCLHFRGRARHTDLFGICLDKGCAPLFNLKLGTLCYNFLAALVGLGEFAGRSGIFVLHYTTGVARTAFGGRSVDGHYAG